MSPPSRFLSARNAFLLPFAAVALHGLTLLPGWWTEPAARMRIFFADPALPASCALGFLLLGAAPLLQSLRLRKAAVALGAAGALVGLVGLVETSATINLGLENLLVQHPDPAFPPGHFPPLLGLCFVVSGSLLAWLAFSPVHRYGQFLPAVAGSLVLAYALPALLANRSGLDQLDFWQRYGLVDQRTAFALLLLGGGFFMLAASGVYETSPETGSRWLWMPVTALGTTASLLFWVSLAEREISYVNGTTQLTINHVATLFHSESENWIGSLARMAARWSETDNPVRAAWERDARDQLEFSPACQRVSWVDPSARTRWIWPVNGNEDAVSLDHSSQPLRREAMDRARTSGTFALAAPLSSPMQAPSFAVYVPIAHSREIAGFIAGEFDYAPLFELIDRRLNISQRYRLEVTIQDSSQDRAAPGLEIYSSGGVTGRVDTRFRQSADFNLFGQRLHFRLVPQPWFLATGRQFLPRIALFSGLSLSGLLGLVVHLAQTARARQKSAERASRELRAENEERRRVEESLRTSQAATRRLTHVARRTQNVVFITTPEGRVEWTNTSFTRLTGRDAAAATGVPLADLLDNPEDAPDSLARISQALRERTALTCEVIIHSSGSGKSSHLHLELQPVRDENATLENFIAIGTDITAIVQTETALRRAKQDADEASRTKSEFLATMSHEIRTPMNGVIGMTSLLLETELNPEQREFVGTIRSAGNTLLAVINEILDFSKIESGRVEIEHQPFELAHCLGEAMEIFALPAAAKKIELASRIDPAVPDWIVLDMSRVRQVLVNLLSNAVKFTARGAITVEVRLDAAGSAPAGDGGRRLIEFVVRDTGIGVPPERRQVLFKPFSQVDSSTTRRYEGAGLGLAISDRLCRLMGGSIVMEDNPGGGSVFRFSILAEPIQSPGAAPFAPLPVPMKGAKVLIACDFPLAQLMLRETVSRLQLTAVEAANPGEAMRLAAGHDIAAAIVDAGLQDGAGATLARDLRQQHPETPVVLLTAPLPSSRRPDQSDSLLAQTFKPVKAAQVLDVLHKFLSGHTTPAPIVPALPAAETLHKMAEGTPLDVLVVEDNPVNQKVATRLLERLGYRADVAGNGLEALQILDLRRFDLVFMDMQMPEMDGLTATREIRRRYPARRQPRIVALTANAVPGDRQRCLEAGMDDYVPKPAKLEDLRAMILKYFSPTESR
jgi:PAS domain S-box-containing protein